MIEELRKTHKKDEDGMRAVADLLNNAADGIGNGVLHVAATSGSCESSINALKTMCNRSRADHIQTKC